MAMQIDRRAFIATVGAGTLAKMGPEDRAEAVEHYMLDLLDGNAHDHAPFRPEDGGDAGALLQQVPGQPRGTGTLLLPPRNGQVLEPVSAKPTFLELFQKRLAAKNHVLQSATHALKTGQPERTVMACLLHDTVQSFIKADHGYFGAQLYAPYVDERITWGIKYHQALRFYPDDAVGYEYPYELYNRIFGEDYVPPDYIRRDYEFAKAHSWYMEARLITVNDLYAFEPGVVLTIDPFVDIIGRNFKEPREGLGYDNSPSAHMWRTIADADKPL
jgi:hypothetical protein